MSANFQWLPPVGLGQPGAPVQTGGGGNGTDVLTFRDSLDARRAAMGRTPSAEYPDGYLGSITDRRQDRMFNALQNRLTDRSYQRGVHKGDKIDAHDYFWPRNGVTPQAGIQAQAKGKRWTQSGSPIERLAHGGKVNALTPSEMAVLQQQYGLSEIMADVDPVRIERYRKLLPSASPTNSPDQWR